MSQNLNTDPSNTENPYVLAYRMSQMEAAVKGLGDKFDQVIKAYPTSEMIRLTIAPIIQDVKEVKRKLERAEEEKDSVQQQFKLAVWTAIIFPIIVGIVIALLTGVIKS